MVSGRIFLTVGRFTLVVLFLLAGLSVEISQGRNETVPAESIQLQFKTPLIPEQMWMFRETDGLNPPEPGVIFWIGRNKGGEGRFLAVTSENVLAENTFSQLLNQSMKENDPNLLYFDSAPARNSFFHRIDLDGDGSDEVLLTGEGGAADNCFLQIFKATPSGVKRIYAGGSRFSLRILDRDGNGEYEVANAGFEWVTKDGAFFPKQFTIYSLKNGTYSATQKMMASEFEQLEHHLRDSKRMNVPLSLQKRPIFKMYQPGNHSPSSRSK